LSRQWRSLPAPDVAEGLILFDGVCVFCSRLVRFVVARDRAARFRFTAIQSRGGRALVERLGIDPEDPETNAVIIDGRAYFKSDAALRVLARLPGWSWSAGLGIAPRKLRDSVYDLIAQNRYRLFGRLDSCIVPGPDLANRLIDDDPMQSESPPA
jgi:predicted DCC family thiol-disulfide oxidoreductase YuxK